MNNTNEQTKFICQGCENHLPMEFNVRTENYCYSCDPNITIDECLSDKPLDRTEIEYAHITPLSEFQPTIDKLKSLGFNPIAATVLFCEDTYVFETKDEVDKACEAVPELCFGWVYDGRSFLEAVKEREEHLDGKKIFIHWLGEYSGT